MPSISCDRYPGTGLLVPNNHPGLLIRNNLPERILPPGHHVLPPGRVEVRLLAAVPPGGEPGPEAIRLPFVRSLLYLDRELVGILVPGETGAPLTAWEGACPRPAPWARKSERPALLGIMRELVREALLPGHVQVHGRPR